MGKPWSSPWKRTWPSWPVTLLNYLFSTSMNRSGNGFAARDIAADRSERSAIERFPEKIPLSGQKIDQ
jgi:hypothetical protein